jgi:hypothetical protein
LSWSRSAKCETTKAGVHYTALLFEMAPQDSCSKSGDPVGPTPSLGFKPFNETTVNQSVQSGVERSRGKVNAPESLDVLR